ncbi:MAG: hypothetical protein HY238_06260 [Acidobacteria bacterium]|nr:hypothetical protein [Acidobacteriota bacterium]
MMIPPLDPAGILTAVLSAAVFTVAIVYAVRSRAVEIVTPLSEALAGEKAPVERELFSTVFVDQPPAARGLLLSVVLHLCVLFGTPLLPYLFPDEIQFDFRRYNVKIMEFRLPRPLLYTAPDRQTAAEPLRPQGARVEKAARAKGRVGAKPVQPAALAANRPKLQLPVSARSGSKDVIIQPDQPPEIAVEMPTPLPTALLWAQGPAPLDVSRMVGAPQRPNLPAFSFPRATPMVQKPNRVPAISDLQVGPAPVFSFRLPQLPVPAANISPVQMPAPAPEQG